MHTGPHGWRVQQAAASHGGADGLFHDRSHAAEERFFQKLEAEVDKCGRFTARLVAELRERLKQLQVRLCFRFFFPEAGSSPRCGDGLGVSGAAVWSRLSSRQLVSRGCNSSACLKLQVWCLCAAQLLVTQCSTRTVVCPCPHRAAAAPLAATLLPPA